MRVMSQMNYNKFSQRVTRQCLITERILSGVFNKLIEESRRFEERARKTMRDK
jgi:hypothetical protein